MGQRATRQIESIMSCKRDASFISGWNRDGRSDAGTERTALLVLGAWRLERTRSMIFLVTNGIETLPWLPVHFAEDVAEPPSTDEAHSPSSLRRATQMRCDAMRCAVMRRRVGAKMVPSSRSSRSGPLETRESTDSPQLNPRILFQKKGPFFVPSMMELSCWNFHRPIMRGAQSIT